MRKLHELDRNKNICKIFLTVSIATLIAGIIIDGSKGDIFFATGITGGVITSTYLLKNY